MRFRNRSETGHAMAARLQHLRGSDTVVLVLPRGGVPVAFEVAEALGAPLDLLMVRKIGAPGLADLAVGAVVDGAQPVTVVNEDVMRDFGISQAYLEEQAAHELAEIERQRALYLRDRPPIVLVGRTVIVVDDGVATGATVRVALQALTRADVARGVLAIPVAPVEVAEALRVLCDEAVFLATPVEFDAVGAFYDDFRQTTDAEVIALLDRAAIQLTAPRSI
jgi:putative phosphoribosyl transferase